jgi:GWxTD domain-containing protein
MNSLHHSTLRMGVMLLVLAFLLDVHGLCAQDAGQTRSIFTNEFTLPFGAHVTMTKTTNDDSLLVVIQYRIRYDMLFFTRVPVKSGMRSDDLMAPISIGLEIVGSNGITNQTLHIADTVLVGGIDKARSKRQFYIGVQTLMIPSNSVALTVDISKSTNRIKTTRYRYLVKRTLAGDSTLTVFAFSQKQEDTQPSSGVASFVLKQGAMLADTIEFSTQARLLCLFPNTYQPGEWAYTIFPDSVKDETAYVANGGGAIGSVMVEEKHFFVRSATTRGEPNTLVMDQGGNSMAGLISLDATLLPQGAYRIIAVSAFGDTLHTRVVVQWAKKPLALRDFDYSLGLMRYLLTDAAIREMTSGGAVEARKKFDAYWQQRDPTPETAFNEDMSEFFARADYAYFAFAGVGITDGARTDRGRVYILNGKPTAIESRILQNNVRREIWKYTDRVFKEFVFESGGSGALVLKNVQDGMSETIQQ